jgi:D-alanyl-D-alanine endopeptidase (penicillin-binding protein 7)
MIKKLITILSLTTSSAFAIPLTAQSWLVTDYNGVLLEGFNTTEIRSIASITKLMTVMVVLDSGQSLTEIIPKKLYNKQLTRETLIDLAIVKSDNNAAKLLCEYYPGGYNSCINAMNNKAHSLQMNQSKFTDPTGLLDTNVSTAEDLTKLVFAASKYSIIIQASNMDAVRWPLNKKKIVEFKNTNNLVGNEHNFLVSKTGWINKSGGCIVMMIDTVYGIRTIVLLGSKNTKTRIAEAQMLAQIIR